MNGRANEHREAGDPPCRECRHYYITYEPAHPWGCRAFGIASTRQPSTVVRESSGQPCRAFEPKPQAKR